MLTYCENCCKPSMFINGIRKSAVSAKMKFGPFIHISDPESV